MSSALARAAAIAWLSIVAACAHGGAVEVHAARRDAGAELGALRSCIDRSERCAELAMRLRSELRQRRDGTSTARQSEQIIATVRRGNAPVVSDVATRCRGGHAASCRALYWAMDRLFLADDASLARAPDCPLTRAFLAAYLDVSASLSGRELSGR